MNIINIAQSLIKMKTITGNKPEILNCLSYCKGLFDGSQAIVNIFQKDKIAPVIFLSNKPTQDFDILVLGHLDVVPASDDMFEPKIENGKLYGRGALDMKSFAAIAFNSLEYVLEHNLDMSFGIILSTDEEQGSNGTKAFLEAYPDLKAKIVLDNDVGGDITKIISKCKNPVFVKIITTGVEAHGSTPWEGVDANDKMLEVLNNVRKIYLPMPKKPANTWVDTVHFAKIEGGKVANIISGYCETLLDFRLIETSSLENLCKNLQSCMIEGVKFEIVSQSVPVVMDEKNTYIQAYKKLAEEELLQKIEFEQIGGATDSREFAQRGSTVIFHSGTGEGMHSTGEYVEISSLEALAKIQIKFLEKYKSL